MSVLFCGYYGQQNAGDDAFNAVSLWGARRFWGVEDCALLSRFSPVLPFPAKAILPARTLFKGHGQLHVVRESVARGDVVYAGGTTLHTKPGPRDPGFYHSLLGRAGLCRLAAIGVSIGPFRDPREQDGIRRFLRDFSFIGVRDSASRRRAAAMGLDGRVLETFDLTALLPMICGKRRRSAAGLRIGVSVCRYETLLRRDPKPEVLRMERIYATLLRLARRLPGAEFRFYAFNTHPVLGDIADTRRLRQRLREQSGARCCVVEYGGDPLALWADVAGCSAVIGTRLHSAIFAYAAGVPFLLAEYHPKCSDFLETVGYCPRLRVPAGFVPAEEGAAAVERLIGMKGVFGLVRLSPENAARRALLNFTAAPLFAG